jgi:hypothetical protein
MISYDTIDECECRTTLNSDSEFNFAKELDPNFGNIEFPKCWINCEYVGTGAKATSANICGCDIE